MSDAYFTPTGKLIVVLTGQPEPLFVKAFSELREREWLQKIGMNVSLFDEIGQWLCKQ